MASMFHPECNRPPAAARRLLWLALVCLPAVAPVAWSWSATGHMLVCDIAWREFQPGTRKAVMRLLRDHTDYTGFDRSCTWADTVRDREAYEYTRPHHYINAPRTALVVRPRRDCGSEGCVLSAIETHRGVLAANGPGAERARSLMFLAHYVGDVHQPMHVSYADDRGGNDARVRFFGEETNLHFLWDGGLIAPRGENPRTRQLGRRLHSSITVDQRRDWVAVSDPTAWANESFQITRREIYPAFKRGRDYDEAYYERYHPVVLQRIKMAGVRLGYLLNQIFHD